MTSEKPLVELGSALIGRINDLKRTYDAANHELNQQTKKYRHAVGEAHRSLRAALARALGVAEWSVEFWDWDCPHAPGGKCVSTPGYYGCRFCGDPEERK
jgi:hypothetical protein